MSNKNMEKKEELVFDPSSSAFSICSNSLSDNSSSTIKKKKRKTLNRSTFPSDVSERGVIYVGRLPFGFFEKELYTFFSQFGEICKLRLLRSKKTGRSKGYAFIEFELKEIAKIVADTMNGYIMFRKSLVCQYIPSNIFNRNIFKGRGCTGDLNIKLKRKLNIKKCINNHSKIYNCLNAIENKCKTSNNEETNDKNNIEEVDAYKPIASALQRRILKEIKKRKILSENNIYFDWEGLDGEIIKKDVKNGETKKNTEKYTNEKNAKNNKSNMTELNNNLQNLKINILKKTLEKVKNIKGNVNNKKVIVLKKSNLLKSRSIKKQTGGKKVNMQRSTTDDKIEIKKKGGEIVYLQKKNK